MGASKVKGKDRTHESSGGASGSSLTTPLPKFPKKVYEAELVRLQEELVKMAEWVKTSGERVVVIFEGRDAAGKGGAIKRITDHLNPRIARVVALPVPSERQERSGTSSATWSNCPPEARSSCSTAVGITARVSKRCSGSARPRSTGFLQQCPIFERLLVADGIHLTKYWFSVSDQEQQRRLEARIHDPMRRWKLSTTDLNSRTRWVDYSRAKDEMFVHTDIPEAPWFVVPADDKRSARLNCMAHLLSRHPYVPKTLEALELPERQHDEGYVRPPREIYTYVPDHAARVFRAADPS